MSTIFSTAGQLAQLSSMRQAQLNKTTADGSATASQGELVDTRPKNVNDAQAAYTPNTIDSKLNDVLTKSQPYSRTQSARSSESFSSGSRLSSDVMAALIQHAQQIAASPQDSSIAVTTNGPVSNSLPADSKTVGES